MNLRPPRPEHGALPSCATSRGVYKTKLSQTKSFVKNRNFRFCWCATPFQKTIHRIVFFGRVLHPGGFIRPNYHRQNLLSKTETFIAVDKLFFKVKGTNLMICAFYPHIYFIFISMSRIPYPKVIFLSHYVLIFLLLFLASFQNGQ